VTTFLDGDLVRLSEQVHGLVQGGPRAHEPGEPTVAVRPWYVEDDGRRRRFAGHSAGDREPFLRALRENGLSFPLASPAVLPFCVMVAPKDILEVRRMTLDEAVDGGRLHPRGWSIADLGRRLGLAAGTLQVTGSVLAGSTAPRDLDLFLPDRDACAPLRSRTLDVDAATERALVADQQTYFVDIEEDVHAVLTARAAWRRLRIGEQQIDLIPRYGVRDGSPLLDCHVLDGVAQEQRTTIGDSPDDCHFPAVYECTDGRLLLGWSRLLQGTLRNGDQVRFNGRRAVVGYRGEQRPAVVVTESDAWHEIEPREGRQ